MRKSFFSKKVVIRIIFILLLIVSVICIEKVLKIKSPHGINQKEALYAQPENSIDVAFMGTSHVHCNINTALLWEEYGIAGYDYSGAEQPLWMTYYYMKELLKYQSPKMIVLDMYAPARFKDDYQYEWIEENIQGMRFSLNKLQMLFDSVELKEFRNYFPDFFSYRSRYAEVKKDDFTYIFQEKEKLESFKGYTPYFDVTEYQLPEVSTDERKGLTSKSEKYLKKIISYADEKDIQLVFIVAPYMITTHDKETYNTIMDIAHENDIIFIDYNEYVEEMGLDYATDLNDDSHLNYSGSCKFTRYLAELLSGSNLPDRRGSEGYESWDEHVLYIKEQLTHEEKQKKDMESSSLPERIQNVNIRETIEGIEEKLQVLQEEIYIEEVSIKDILGNELYKHKLSSIDGSPLQDTGKKMMELFSNDGDNIWVFTGGEAVAPGFSDLAGARNYISHFEEYIRWQLASDENMGEEEIKNVRQRYVINAGKKERDISEIVEGWQDIVMKNNPKAIVYHLGMEDYGKGENGVSEFCKQLTKFLDQGLTAGNKDKIIIIQLPFCTGNEETDSKIEMYIEAVCNVLNNPENGYITDQQIYERIVIINHYAAIKNKEEWVKEGVKDGKLTPKGHLELGCQLAEAVTEGIGFYPSNSHDKLFNSRLVFNITPKEKCQETGANQEHDIDSNQQKENKLTKLLGRKDAVRWLFVGDSITHGNLFTHGYDNTAQLFEKYIREELGRPDDIIINTAVWASTIEDYLDEKYADVRLDWEADVVIVMLGTNDAGMSALRQEEVFKNNFYNLLKTIKEYNKDAIIVVRTPIYTAEESRVTNLLPVLSYMEELSAIKEEEDGLADFYIDQYTPSARMLAGFPWLYGEGKGKDLLYGDNIHPNELGHLLMFRRLIDELGLWRDDSPMLNFYYDKIQYDEEVRIEDLSKYYTIDGEGTFIFDVDSFLTEHGELGNIHLMVTDIATGQRYERHKRMSVIIREEADKVEVCWEKGSKLIVEDLDVNANYKVEACGWSVSEAKLIRIN